MGTINDNNRRDDLIGVSCAVLCKTYEHGKRCEDQEKCRSSPEAETGWYETSIDGIVELKPTVIPEPGPLEWSDPLYRSINPKEILGDNYY